MPRQGKKQIVKGLKCATARLLDYSTIEYARKNGERVIRLHNTDLLTFYPNGNIEFNTGGLKTYLQRRRINQYQNHLWIYAVNGDWYYHHTDDASAWRRPKVPFYDGLTINYKGKIL